MDGTRAVLDAFQERPDVEEERRLIAAAQAGDTKARDRLMNSMWPLVVQHANRRGRDEHEREEMIQNAAMGLMLAVQSFDLRRDVRFCTHAFGQVFGKTLRVFQDSELRRKRLPTASLYEPTGAVGKGREKVLLDTVPNEKSDLPADGAAKLEAKRNVERLLSTLDDRRGTAIRMVMNGHTLDEVGKAIGVTRERARQLHLSGMEKLKIRAAVIRGNGGFTGRMPITRKPQAIKQAPPPDIAAKEEPEFTMPPPSKTDEYKPVREYVLRAMESGKPMTAGEIVQAVADMNPWGRSGDEFKMRAHYRDNVYGNLDYMRKKKVVTKEGKHWSLVDKTCPIRVYQRKEEETVAQPNQDLRREIFTLDEGPAEFTVPKTLSKVSIEELEDWLALICKQLRRRAEQAAKEPDEELEEVFA